MMVPVSIKSILVVDDDVLILQTMEMLLAFDGHRVETATDGESALKKFAIQDFDIVFTDHSMAKMSGEVLAMAIKKQSPQQIVVMVTGSADLVIPKKAYQTYIDFTLQKPFHIQELREIIQKAILKKAAKVPEFSFGC
jgi:DNA-binding NtrC family response regulator